jgi:hypothetical protein
MSLAKRELERELEGEDETSPWIKRARDGHIYFECIKCGHRGDPGTEHHSGGYCNMCHAMSKDD